MKDDIIALKSFILDERDPRNFKTAIKRIPNMIKNILMTRKYTNLMYKLKVALHPIVRLEQHSLALVFHILAQIVEYTTESNDIVEDEFGLLSALQDWEVIVLKHVDTSLLSLQDGLLRLVPWWIAAKPDFCNVIMELCFTNFNQNNEGICHPSLLFRILMEFGSNNTKLFFDNISPWVSISSKTRRAAITLVFSFILKYNNKAPVIFTESGIWENFMLLFFIIIQTLIEITNLKSIFDFIDGIFEARTNQLSIRTHVKSSAKRMLSRIDLRNEEVSTIKKNTMNLAKESAMNLEKSMNKIHENSAENISSESSNSISKNLHQFYTAYEEQIKNIVAYSFILSSIVILGVIGMFAYHYHSVSKMAPDFDFGADCSNQQSATASWIAKRNSMLSANRNKSVSSNETLIYETPHVSPDTEQGMVGHGGWGNMYGDQAVTTSGIPTTTEVIAGGLLPQPDKDPKDHSGDFNTCSEDESCYDSDDAIRSKERVKSEEDSDLDEDGHPIRFALQGEYTSTLCDNASLTSSDDDFSDADTL